MLLTLFAVCHTFTSRFGTDSNGGNQTESAEIPDVVGWCTHYVYYVIANYGMWQYKVIVPFLRNETKTERPFPLYETPHLLDEMNGRF